MMGELIGIQRATAKGMDVDDVPAAPMTADSFEPTSSDVWVNGLWFTTLGLSLVTALIAILAKQWVQQYLFLPSVSPQERSRVRHFRFMCLQNWQVPLIINVLPVMMHASLALFLAGLVVYLYALRRTIAAILAFIGGLAFLMYFISNTLPVFYPGCPYKTPLSNYAYAMANYVDAKLKQWQHGPHAVTAPSSLKNMERKTVANKAHALDAFLLSWLHNTSLNLSVQGLVLQAFSSLPLRSIPIVNGPYGITSILKAIDIHCPARIEPLDRFLRFQRAALRFSANATDEEVSRYAVLGDFSPMTAADLICENIQMSSSAEGFAKLPLMDALYWAKVFQGALSEGFHWLDLKTDPPSEIWCHLLETAVEEHCCVNAWCGDNPQDLLEFPMTLKDKSHTHPSLSIIGYNDHNRRCRTFSGTLIMNMGPSFQRWLLHVGFPNVSRSSLDYSDDLPDDVVLLFAMAQSATIQRTSFSMAPISKFVSDGEDQRCSLFRKVLMLLQTYVLGSCEDIRRHLDVDKAIIAVLRKVALSPAFGLGTLMTGNDEGLLISVLFSALNRQIGRHGPQTHDFTWLTPVLGHTVLNVAFSREENCVEVVAHVLRYLVHSGSCTLITLEDMFSRLIQADWMRGTRIELLDVSAPDVDDLCTYGSFSSYVALPTLFPNMHRYTGPLASSFVDGLPIFSAASSPSLDSAIRYINQPGNLTLVCKVLLVSDVDTQRRLWKLSEFIPFDNNWDCCLQELAVFAASDLAKPKYSLNSNLDGNHISFVSSEGLPSLVNDLQENLQTQHFLPQTQRRPAMIGLQSTSCSI